MCPLLRWCMRDLFQIVATVPDPDRDSHQIIVDQAAEGREDAHEEGDVSEDEDSLHGGGLSPDHILEDAEQGSHQKEHCTVPDVTEHDTEEEREGHHCEYSRIDLLVVRYAISVNDLLEDPGDIVRAEQRRRLDAVIMHDLELWDLDVTVLCLDTLDLSHCHFIVKVGDPAEANVETSLYLELVQSSIESLLFHNEHLVNLEDRDLEDVFVDISIIMHIRAVNDLLDTLEVVLKAKAGIIYKIFCIIDSSFQVLNSSLNFVVAQSRGDVNLASHKGLAYLGQLLSDCGTLLENDDINSAEASVNAS